MVKVLTNKGTKFVFHDASINGQIQAVEWENLFDPNDREDVVFDHHYYQAWNKDMYTTDDFCNEYKKYAEEAELVNYDVWFGEWSLATDACAHWLGGFNDGNKDPDPKMQCK